MNALAHGPLSLLALCLLLLTGCRVLAPKYGTDARVHSTKDIVANSEQVRLRARALVQPLSGVIVAAADQIMSGTTNRAVRRQALLWKLEAVPALREALFQPNPLTAVFDAWVMAFQMTDYFEKGRGREGLGDAHSIAVTTCQHLEAELARVAASLTVSGDVSKARAMAGQWAADHPLRQSISSRESALDQLTEAAVATSLSTGEAMGSLAVTLEDLNRRLEIYSAQVLDQSRWQAELFALDLTQDLQVEKAMALAESAVRSTDCGVQAFDRVVSAAERAVVVVEKTPTLVTAEREAAVKAIQAEVTRTLTSVQGERIAVLKDLTTERIAALQELRDVVAHERAALIQDLGVTSVKVVDHAFQRATRLGAVALVALFFGALFYHFLAARLPSTMPSKPNPT